MRIRTGVYWSAGARRGRNQDSLSLQHVMLRRGECLLALVCDGIGSLDCSEEASGYVAAAMTDWFYHEGKQLIWQGSGEEGILLALRRQLDRIQENLRKLQQQREIRTGTTCSGLLLIRNRYYFIHIGDSRIYRIREKTIPTIKRKYELKCLTRDDTNAEGYLLKCFGMDGLDRAVLECGRVRRRTAFLLCTDGLCPQGIEEHFAQTIGAALSRSGERRGRGNGRGRENDKGRRDGREHGSMGRRDVGLDRRLELLGEQAAYLGSRDNMAAVCVIIE